MQQERESQTTAQPPQCACVGMSYFAKRPIRGGSAGIRNLYLYVTSSGDICYGNWSYVTIVQCVVDCEL